MRKGESIVVLEKEIRRLNKLGSQVQEEANMRRFFLAAVLQKTGPVELTADEISSMRTKLGEKEIDLHAEAVADGAIKFSLIKGSGAGLEEPKLGWWARFCARVMLWWWSST